MNELHFQSELFKDEELLWTGQPRPKIFARADIWIIPFSIIWGGIASLLGLGFFLTESIVFMVIGVFILFVGLYFAFGRFIYKIWKQKHTYYAVTNRRIIILTNTWSKNVQTAFIDTLPAINKSINSQGRGTIKFGNTTFWGSMYENTGLEFMMMGYGKEAPLFYNIDDAKKVYDLVTELRMKSAKKGF